METHLNFVSRVLTSWIDEPTYTQLEQIAEFTKSSLVDQDALRVRLFNLQAMSQWEWMRNTLRVILHCVVAGSESFRERAKGNTLWLIGVVLCTPEILQEAAIRGPFVQQHVQQFVHRTREELNGDLDRLLRTIRDPRNISYHASIGRANHLLRLASVGDAYSGQLVTLQQSYNVFHAVSLLAFNPVPTATEVDLNARSVLQVPTAVFELLSGLIRCISHINSNPTIRERLLEACGDDAECIMYGLQAILDAHAQGYKSFARAPVLRLLQDVSCKTVLLPKDYWLSEIEEGENIGFGGEADIFKGVLRGSEPQDVVLRKIRRKTVAKIILREAITHRQLKHPNVLPFLGIFKTAVPPGAIVTPWVPNGDAFDYMERNSSPNCLMQITLGLSSAVNYIHSLDPSVIHGDIRARNVLIDINGNPLLCDFGLSRIKHELTRTHTSIHSGGWHVAPELCEDVDFRTTPESDIFSFAMTIYELGTQSQPFPRKNVFGASKMIQDGMRPEQPSNLAGLGPRTAARLWDLVVQMWKHDRQLRPSAARVLNELQHINAERNSDRAMASTSVPRLRASESSHTGALRTPTVSSITTSLSSTHISTPQTPEHTRPLNIPSVNPVNTALQAPGQQSGRWSTMSCQTLTAHTDKIVSVAYAPNRDEFASGSTDICIWAGSRDSGGTSWAPRCDWSITQLACLSYSFDGGLLAAGTYNEIKLWDTNTGENRGALKSKGRGKYVTALTSSPSNHMMASGSKDKTVLLWDTRAKAKIGTPLVGHAEAVTSVAFSPSGGTLASASSDKTVRLWDIRVGRCISQLSGFTEKVTAASFSPDGRYIAAASDDRTIRRWNAQTFDEIGSALRGHDASIRCLAFSPDSAQIASGSVDMTIRIWDSSTGASVGSPLGGHHGTIESITFSPDGGKMVSGSRDKTLKVWSAEH